MFLYSLASSSMQLFTCYFGKPGCGQVFVLDGNMKNNREVCYAVDAGYAEFRGLPGKIKTGCINTPAFKSRYCSIHIPCVVHHQSDGSDIQVPTTSFGPKVAGIIIDKRVTRTSVLYKVCQNLYVHLGLCLCNLICLIVLAYVGCMAWTSYP